MVWCKSAFCRWKFDTSWLFTLHGWRVFPFLRTDSTDAPSLGWSNSFYHTKPNLARPMKKPSLQIQFRAPWRSSFTFPLRDLVKKISRSKAETQLTLGWLFNPIQGGGGSISPPCHVFAYTRVYIHIHAPIFFDNSSFLVWKRGQHFPLNKIAPFSQD